MTEKHVLRRREILYEIELLMDKRESLRPGIRGAIQPDRLSAQGNPSPVRLNHPGENLNQRRFPRPVLTYEPVYLCGVDRKLDSF